MKVELTSLRRNKANLFNYLNRVTRQVDLSWLVNNVNSVKSFSIINTTSKRYPVLLVVHLRHTSYMKLECKFMNKEVCYQFTQLLQTQQAPF